jgi:hypothetical protein
MAPAAGDPDAVLAELRALRYEMKRQSSEARYLDASRNGVTDAAGYLTLALPVVPEGFRDRILYSYIAGLYYSQVAAGIAVAFITSSLPGITDVGIPTTLVRDFTATIPNKAFYDQYQMVVHQGSFFALQVYDSTFSAAQYAWHVAFIREPLTEHRSVAP